MQRIAEIDIPLDAGDFCLMDRRVVDILCSMPERNRFIRGIRSWIGFRQTGIPYRREMRKFNVTLLIIDQRPSGIDDEVMSQLGTKITCLLDNEHDIDSVLAGISGRNELKSVLAKLESRQQALIFGHALPMPVVVKTREYGSAESYREFGFRDAAQLKKKAEALNIAVDADWSKGDLAEAIVSFVKRLEVRMGQGR
jgi:hypothetical protein